MAFSPIGLVVGAALARDVKDRGRAGQIEILGGVLGTSPIGLVLLATLAKQAGVGTSSGPPNAPSEASVPDVRDASDLAEATAILKAHGLAGGRAQYVVSDSPKDAILGSAPEAGAVVALGTEVSVRVSAGLVVPTVTGLAVAEAERALETAGFASNLQLTDTPGAPGTVAKQDPAAGDLASSGDTVTVFVTRESRRGSTTTSGDEATTTEPV